jgi:hypothetical protein
MVDECSVNTAKKKHLVVCTAQNWRENRQLDKNLADNWRIIGEAIFSLMPY